MFTDVHAGTGQQGALIIDRSGRLAYFEPVSDHGGNGRRIFNVRVQEYRGEPVMTYWLGPMVSGHGEGDYYLYDQSYRQVAKVQAGNGYKGDLHEFRLTPRGTALLSAYGTAHAEITSSDVAGGSHYGPYFYGIAQEVDVATGRVLMQWRSDEHVPLEASHEKPPNFGRQELGLLPHQLDRGRSRRRQPDHLGTQLLGVLQGRSPHRRGDLALRRRATTISGWGRERRSASSTTSSRTGTACSPCSTTRVARRRRRASHGVWSCTSTSDTGESGSCGRCTTAPASTRVRWAASRSSSTAASSWAGASRPGSPNTTATAGSCSTRGSSRSDVNSYRAFQNRWSGRPHWRPAVAVTRSGRGATVYVSWNGATVHRSWQVLGGDRADDLRPIQTHAVDGFETAIVLDHAPARVAVRALDERGGELSLSDVVST